MGTSPTRTEQPRFALGDRVVHAGKPEWGVGVISTSSPATHGGVACQRLVIRFDRVGLKTVSTGVADIRVAQGRVGTIAERDAGSASENPLLGADAHEARRIMTTIPERARDPFASASARLRETLALYRFSDSGASLIEWGVLMSGLSDPLSRFSRHELEDYFSLFGRVLDEHLAREVRGAGSIPRGELVEIARNAPERGQQALRRIHARR